MSGGQNTLNALTLHHNNPRRQSRQNPLNSLPKPYVTCDLSQALLAYSCSHPDIHTVTPSPPHRNPGIESTVRQWKSISDVSYNTHKILAKGLFSFYDVVTVLYHLHVSFKRSESSGKFYKF